MSILKTTEEFSSRRKVLLGSSNEPKSAFAYQLKPSNISATFTPHKAFYGKDNQNNDAYFIEFTIGDFHFDEITIRTEGRRLIVQGKSQQKGPEEVSHEFTRDFTLPPDVDPFSIKAQLDDATKLLTLVGIVKTKENEYEKASSTRTGTQTSSSLSNDLRLGTTKENQNKAFVEYEIFLGNDLRDGQIKLEITNYLMNVNVSKKNWDKFGDYYLELKRQIKLPANCDFSNIEYGVDMRTQCLLIKVPTNS